MSKGNPMRISVLLILVGSISGSVCAMSSQRPIDVLCGEKIETTSLTQKKIYQLTQPSLRKAGMSHMVEAILHKDKINYSKEFSPVATDPLNLKESVLNTYRNTIGSMLEKQYASEKKVSPKDTHCKFVSDNEKFLYKDQGMINESRRKLSITFFLDYEVSFECFVLEKKSTEELRVAHCEAMDKCLVRQTDKVVIEEFKNQKEFYCSGDVNLAMRPSKMGLDPKINDSERSRVKEIRSRRIEMDFSGIKSLKDVSGVKKE